MDNMKTVLVIEDDDSLRFMYQELLETEGYTALLTDNPEDALDLAGLTRSRCNVILGPILKESENHGKETSYS
jgi:DNA-binding NtrC family response regulator